MNQKEKLNPLGQGCGAQQRRQGGEVATVLACECAVELSLPAAELIDDFLLYGKLLRIMFGVESGESLPEWGLLLVQKKPVREFSTSDKCNLPTGRG